MLPELPTKRAHFGWLAKSLTFAVFVSGIGVANLAAQSAGQVAGNLTDQSGAVVAGARVRIDGRPGAVVSDARGAFRLTDIPQGAHRIIVTAEGYAELAQDVTVRAGAPTELQIRLTSVYALEGVSVEASRLPGSVTHAPDVSRGLVLAGTSNAIIQIEGVAANLAEKTGRQIFARIPGAFVYDMDGSGNQVNVSTRGLDPHRSWELNVRQDGVLLNSDLYGYPASHYSPPMEGVERLEVIRGTAALQYGSQYGGLLNYVTKSPQTEGLIGFESISSAGSFGLLSTYNAVGGVLGPVTYYGYMNERRSDGYREGAASDYSAQFFSANARMSPTVGLRGQIGHSVYVYDIPGPLTDAMFEQNPRQATRSRNYYSPNITIPSLTLDWRPSNGANLTTTVSGVIGPRNSVQFEGFADRLDNPDPVTGTYGVRMVDIDNFRSLTLESRLVLPWNLRGLGQSLATGVAFSNNRMRRRQQGPSAAPYGFDLSVSGDFRRDMFYRTVNGAAYIENLFRLTPAWTLVPGVRVEVGRTRMTGRLAYYDPANTPTEIVHKYPLIGLRSSYNFASGVEAYGGWSQAYRPQILKDVIPANALERTDTDLKDSRGWTVEAGLRGTLAGRLAYDVGVFQMRIGDRFGTLLQSDPDGTNYLFRTNIGTSRTRGIETSLEAWLIQRPGFTVWAHTSTSYYQGRYLAGTVTSGGRNVDITGNNVESIPHWISRNSLSLESGRVSLSTLVSHTSSSFADALNTVAPSANGAIGVVPSHTVLDLNGSVSVTSWLRLRGGINNVFDLQYFTKRPQFYPGPGVWPSDGRSMQVTAEVRHWPGS